MDTPAWPPPLPPDAPPHDLQALRLREAAKVLTIQDECRRLWEGSVRRLEPEPAYLQLERQAKALHARLMAAAQRGWLN